MKEECCHFNIHSDKSSYSINESERIHMGSFFNICNIYIRFSLYVEEKNTTEIRKIRKHNQLTLTSISDKLDTFMRMMDMFPMLKVLR